ncbi:hypothetical protein [Mesorhizobium sp. LSJC264A00]|uniref:hypothetical protein n=1 Tax=unclassified Mesorhizobium TaxID=325217 RepID=UPI0003CDFF0C|nr:hypothetical protein [Mesorhizobium sp. LSJC264A00]ESX24123.1 hypothetical protein X767_13115 [Mesorhizobium sp. LSJC264A00]
MAVSFTGLWSYRSLINSPDLSVTFNDLRFGAGTLDLNEPDPGKIGGSLGGVGWSLALDGTATEGNPPIFRWQGRGMIGGEAWVYDYLGYLVPDWPDGVGQTDTIVGSVIRTVPHSNGQATAGYTASFYAVRASG